MLLLKEIPSVTNTWNDEDVDGSLVMVVWGLLEPPTHMWALEYIAFAQTLNWVCWTPWDFVLFCFAFCWGSPGFLKSYCKWDATYHYNTPTTVFVEQIYPKEIQYLPLFRVKFGPGILAYWHKRLPGNLEVVSSIPHMKGKKKNPKNPKQILPQSHYF